MSKDKADEPVVMNQVHTYPDGSQVVGCPPFPEKSPIERALAINESGREPDGHKSARSNVVTADHVEVSLVEPAAEASTQTPVKAPRKNAKKAR